MDSFDWSAVETGGRKNQGLLGVGMANFQGVREFQVVPIAPLTLIYGQNSAGKSSIQDALTLFRGLTCGSKDTTEMLRRWSRKSKSRKFPIEPMTISVFCRPGLYWDDEWEKSYFNTESSFQERNKSWLPILYSEDALCEISIEYSCGLHGTCMGPKIECVRISFDGGLFSSTYFDEREDGWSYEANIDFNSEHPLYEKLDAAFGGRNRFSLLLETVGKKSDESYYDLKLPIYRSDESDGLQGIRFEWDHLRTENAYPDLNELEQAKDFLAFLVAGLPNLAGCACQCSDVPPVRPMPTEQDAVFVNPRLYWMTEQQGGKNWWEHLACLALDSKTGKSCTEFKQISDALELPNKLDTGYRLDSHIHYIVDENLLRPKNKKRRATTETILSESGKQVRLFLRDKKGHQLRFDDVGSGVSQLIPVLIGIFFNSKVYLHQPELHLHPRLQAQLADMIIECINTKEIIGETSYARGTKFIETHSEHLLLRILKRIRQTNDGAAIPAEQQLLPNQVSVIYVDRDEEHGTIFKPLRISRTGEFMDRWPHGFFAEREQELFDE